MDTREKHDIPLYYYNSDGTHLTTNLCVKLKTLEWSHYKTEQLWSTYLGLEDENISIYNPTVYEASLSHSAFNTNYAPCGVTNMMIFKIPITLFNKNVGIFYNPKCSGPHISMLTQAFPPILMISPKHYTPRQYRYIHERLIAYSRDLESLNRYDLDDQKNPVGQYLWYHRYTVSEVLSLCSLFYPYNRNNVLVSTEYVNQLLQDPTIEKTEYIYNVE